MVLWVGGCYGLALALYRQDGLTASSGPGIVVNERAESGHQALSERND